MSKSSLPNLKIDWEDCIVSEQEDKERDNIQKYSCKISKNTILKYTQFNYLHTTYMKPKRLNRVEGNEDRKFPSCEYAYVDFFHMVWGCPDITCF